MPIPTYQSRQSLPRRSGTIQLNPGMGQAPAVRMDPGALSAGSNAAVQASDTLANSMAVLVGLGEQLHNQGQRLVQTDQVARRNANLVALRGELTTLAESYQDRGDFTQWEEDYQAKAQDLKSRYSDGLVGPWADSYQSHADGQVLQGYVQVRGMARRQASSVWGAAFVGREKDLLSESYQAGTVKARGLAVSKYEDMVNEGVELNYLSPEAGAKKKLAFKAQADMLLAETAAQADPSGFLAAIKDPDYLASLDPTDRIKVTRQAEIFKRQQEKEQQEKQVDLLVADLRRKHGLNYNAMSEYLARPEVIEKYGNDGVREAWNMVQAFDAQAREQERQLKTAGAKRELKEAYELMAGGDLAGAASRARRFKFVGPEAQFRLQKAAAKGMTTTTDKAWAEFTHQLYYLGVHHTREQLAAIGIMPDKLDDAMKEVAKARGEAAGGKFDYFKNAVAQFSGQEKDKAKVQRFSLALRAQMDTEKIGPTDMKVMQVAKALRQEMVTESGTIWDTEGPIYEYVAGQVETSGQAPAELRDAEGRLVYDPRLPDTPAELLVNAQKQAEKDGQSWNDLPVHQRRRWTVAAQQGVTIDQVPVLNAESIQELNELYPPEVIRWAETALGKYGYKTTPRNIDAMIKRYRPEFAPADQRQRGAAR
ncbi:MAG: hypothetical protein K9K66_04465 [Desulfarculaceae bacterium]|nr:hypothetical protein [Desulfarculaceae bacterium]MCF8073297.1 hypothetical protein [Desulfarculaceae bacterium]MCF8100893.1 hypothetical protein [Desulfarculaceae bacterium]MCF8116651.1 hypothetical protein [Desulfarculaceae bacterium]